MLSFHLSYIYIDLSSQSFESLDSGTSDTYRQLSFVIMPKSQGIKTINQSSGGRVALGNIETLAQHHSFSNHQSLPERRLGLFNRCIIQEMPRLITIHEANIFDILTTKEPSEEPMQSPPSGYFMAPKIDAFDGGKACRVQKDEKPHGGYTSQ